MSLSLLIPAGVLAAGGYLFQHGQGQQATAAERRLAGLQDIRQLRGLLETLPQHRGMANGLLQGDESFRAKLTELQARIDADMRRLQEITAGGDPWAVAGRCGQIRRQWDSLKGGLQKLQPQESFARHSLLIQELLYLINDIGDGAGLLSHGGALAATIIDRIPLVTEILGQARGMGTGAATHGRCDTAMRVKLQFLLHKAQTVSDQLKREQGSTQGSKTGLRKNAQEATENFLGLLRERIIEAPDISLSPSDYFSAGTQAIQHNFVLLDKLMEVLQSQLEADLARERNRRTLSRAAAGLLLLPALWLARLAF